MALDENMSWKQHISATRTKIVRAIYAINHAKHFLTYKALKTLFLTLVQSHVQYGAIAWGNSTNNNQILLLLQKRAIRVINNKSYRAHTDPL